LNTVVNCAGLRAPDVARLISGLPADKIPQAYFAKAHYYTLSGKSPFNHLVYPVAHTAFLGVHVTLDMGGQARFGPDLDWIDEINYTFDPAREPLFYEAILRSDPPLLPRPAGWAATTRLYRHPPENFRTKRTSSRLSYRRASRSRRRRIGQLIRD
jgi:hypothetical protein